ncbi:MAG: phage portal protein [Candidatus Nezhaarchaeales archaeon]
MSRQRNPERFKSQTYNTFHISAGRIDSVVRPQDIYREQSETYRAAFDVYDYIPFIEVGELEHLNALVQNSATAQAVLNKIATYTIGHGFTVKDKRMVLGEEVTVELSDEQKTELWEILTRVNHDNETILEICRKSAYDFKQFGNCYGQIDVIPAAGENIVYLTHQHTNFVRPYRSRDLKTRFYGISQDWGTVPYILNNSFASLTEAEKAELAQREYLPSYVHNVPAYPSFNQEDVYSYTDVAGELDEDEQLEDPGIVSSMLHAKQYSPEFYFWGLPDWIGAKHWVELEYRIAKFNVSKFQNGLTPSGILQMFGDLTDDQKKQYIHDMREKMTNTGNDFKVIFQISENPDLVTKWIPTETSYQGFFMELATLCKEFIAVGMGVPLSLVQATPGQLGNNQQIRSEFELLYNTEIFEIQQTILKKIVKPYLDTVAEYENKPWLKEIELDFKNIVPVSYKGDLDVNKLISVNEGRELIGYEAQEEIRAEEMIELDEPQQLNAMRRFFNWFKRK